MEVEKKAEVAMEMSDLVVYCQPRSKDKERFGMTYDPHPTHKHTHTANFVIYISIRLCTSIVFQ